MEAVSHVSKEHTAGEEKKALFFRDIGEPAP